MSLPPQVINAKLGTIRASSIDDGKQNMEKQMTLISGGKRKKTKYFGGTDGTIVPPTVPNTGVSSASMASQQSTYNQLAMLNDSVNKNASYDNAVKVAGYRKKKYTTKCNHKTKRNHKTKCKHNHKTKCKYNHMKKTMKRRR